MARIARAIAAVAVVVALGGGAFAAYNYISTSRATARLEYAQKEFSDALQKEASLRIGADVRAHIARAAYHVEDRKSTRLNSSHPSISYAVFCLKKKKKTK